MTLAPTIIEAIAAHAENRPEAPALCLYGGNLEVVGQLSYRQLLQRASRSARALSHRVNAGDAVLVALKFGPDYVVQILSCMMAGAIPIPAMPATRRSLDRLLSMIRVGRPRYCLHDDDMGRFAIDAIRLAGTPSLPVSDLEDEGHGSFRMPRQSDVALYQFTSGSTNTPKGVVISHANIVANQLAIAKGFGHSGPVTLLGWLPLYHDMGLIGNVLQPLFLGGTAAMISPLDVITRPARWLKLIEKCGAHTSGGPNFIYDMCIRRVCEGEMATLRLDHWTTAFNGSETVRAHTLERFAQKFERCGFRYEALLPCYGLAEATLFVTAERYGARLAATTTVSNQPHATMPVVCGPVDQDTHVVVVSDKRSEPVPNGVVGEILISGPSVASAYLIEDGLDTGPFSVQVDGYGDRPFHRTGDQGFIVEGHLVITGRRKDVIKLRGTSIHAEDLESLIERDCTEIEDHSTCVVGIPDEQGDESVAVIIEASGDISVDNRKRLVNSIKEAASLHAGVAIHRIIFVPRNSLSRTSSGKFARGNCRASLLNGEFDAVKAHL